MNKIKVIALAFGICCAQKNVYSMNMNAVEDSIKHLQEIDLKTFTPPSEDKFREVTAGENALQAAILDIAFVTGVIYQGQVDFTQYHINTPPELFSLNEFKKIWAKLQQRIGNYIAAIKYDNENLENALSSRKSEDFNTFINQIKVEKSALNDSIVDFYRCFKIAPVSSSIQHKIDQNTALEWNDLQKWRTKVQADLNDLDQNFKKTVQKLQDLDLNS